MGTKYAGYFTSHATRKVEVEISNESYTGEVFPLSFSGDGVVITVPGKEIFDVMLSRGCEIFAFCTKKGEFSELFGTAERTWRVVVKYDNEVVFNGFVNPVMYTEDLANVAHDVVIPCTDGLSQLEDYTPDLVIPSDSFVKIDNIIKACLLCTGLDLPVVYSSEILINELNKIQNSTFFSPEFLQENDGDLVKRKNAKQLLEEICTPFFWRLQQKGNSWCISRLCDIKKSVAKVIGTASLPYVSVAPVATVDSGFGELTVQFNEKQTSGAIENNTTEPPEYIFKSQINTWRDLTPGEVLDRSILKKWVSIGVETENKYRQSICFFADYFRVQADSFVKWPVCALVYSTEMIFNTGEKLDITMKCHALGDSTYDMTGRFQVGFVVLNNGVYHNLFNGGGKIIYRDSFLEYEKQNFEIKNIKNGNGGDSLIKLTTEYLNKLSGVIRIFVILKPIFVLSPIHETFTMYHAKCKISLKISKSNIETPKNTFRAINKSIKYLRVAPDANIDLDTCQFFKNSLFPNDFFRNILRHNDGAPIMGILDPVTNKEIPLHELVINDRMRQYERPTESVGVTVNMDHFLHTTEKIEIADRGKSYVINGAKYTLLEDDIQMDLKEIV